MPVSLPSSKPLDCTVDPYLAERTRYAGLKAIADLNGWRLAALESLLLQVEANQRILYLESVLADILDDDFKLRYPFMASKIETALYPPLV